MVSKLVFTEGYSDSNTKPPSPKPPNLLLAEQLCLDKKIPTTFIQKKKVQMDKNHYITNPNKALLFSGNPVNLPDVCSVSFIPNG